MLIVFKISPMPNGTPMMRQYRELKNKYSDCILFFRLGDFYEMFDTDAEIASQILGITLTHRNKGDNRVKMCGIPFHSSATYIQKLTSTGKKVAVCEQLSDPSLPGIVKRDVIRIITPATNIDEKALDAKSGNYIAAAFFDSSVIGVCLCDFSTGETRLTTAHSSQDLKDLFEKYKPHELLHNDYDKSKKIDQLTNLTAGFFSFSQELPNNYLEILTTHFGEIDPKINFSSSSLKAAAMLLNYLKSTQKNELEHLKHLDILAEDDLVGLDESTIKNLEILENMREKKVDGSMLHVIDRTLTSAGARLIKKTLVEPMKNKDLIEKRLNIVEYLIEQSGFLLDLRQILKGISDIQRIVARLSLQNGNARDLRQLINSFERISELKNAFKKHDTSIFHEIYEKIDYFPELFQKLDKAILDEPPFSIKEGNMIKPDFCKELDELRNISRDGKNYIQALQTREIQNTGISSLKVKFNRVFGYYIEISKANIPNAPDHYERKQTLANAERFTTHELKEYERKVLSAEEKIIVLEEKIFNELRQDILRNNEEINKTAKQIAYMDMLCSFAITSWENNYVRPTITTGDELFIQDGRHPVVEKLNSSFKFVGNDLILNEKQRIMLITGPNMGGKSTYLRQNALIVLMALIGMFVPAKVAIIPKVDRIFTRVGASDNLVRGQSTFLVEMAESALILSKATKNSLVILDEIGRGTSTFDGVSIAWSIMEYIHNEIKAKTLFASHYHELISLAKSLETAVNYSVMAEEKNDDIEFLYRIQPGGANKSYGIAVAKLAGLPGKVIGRAKQILNDLEKKTHQKIYNFDFPRKQTSLDSISQFSSQKNKLKDEISTLDINNTSPFEALLKLKSLKELAENLNE